MLLLRRIPNERCIEKRSQVWFRVEDAVRHVPASPRTKHVGLESARDQGPRAKQRAQLRSLLSAVERRVLIDEVAQSATGLFHAPPVAPLGGCDH